MSTYTATRTRKFGTDDQRDRFAATYGSADYATVGRAIAAEQRKHNHRQEATVNDTDRATRQTVERMVALAAERTPHVTEAQIFQFAATNSADVVHARLVWLEAQPVAHRNEVQDKPAPRVDVPAGRYAVTGEDGTTKFYRVDRPTEGKWKGYTFVKVQASDELHNVRSRATREAVLAKIASDGIQEAMLRYGREIGQCGHCGRTLTNEESREIGIGPKCRSKMGW